MSEPNDRRARRSSSGRTPYGNESSRPRRGDFQDNCYAGSTRDQNLQSRSRRSSSNQRPYSDQPSPSRRSYTQDNRRSSPSRRSYAQGSGRPSSSQRPRSQTDNAYRPSRNSAPSQRQRQRYSDPHRSRERSAAGYNRDTRRYSSRIPATPNSSRPPFKWAVIGLVAVLAGVALFWLFACPKEGEAPNDGTTTSQTNSALSTSQNVIMTLEGDKNTLVLRGEDYLEPGCKATDKKSGTITCDMKIEGKVDTNKVGDYEITYTATMPNGSIGQAKRTVHVVDSFEEVATTIPVLMYHYVFTEDDSEDKEDANYILDSKLRDQVEYLKKNNYYYPSYQEIRGFVEGTHTLPAKSVVLTFDDGEDGFLKYGVPIFNELEVPATSFIVCIDAGSKLVDYASEYVQFQSHTYDMHRDGLSVGQGGVIHGMSQQEIYDDVEKSKAILGGVVDAIAYPYGDNNENAWAAFAEAGVPCAFTVKNARISPGDNPLALNRVRISGDYEQEGFEYLVTPNGGEQ